MDVTRKNLLDSEYRPLHEAAIYHVEWENTKKRSVEMQVKGYITQPASDGMVETRMYSFPTPLDAIKTGLLLVQEGVSCQVHNLIKRK